MRSTLHSGNRMESRIDSCTIPALLSISLLAPGQRTTYFIGEVSAMHTPPQRRSYQARYLFGCRTVLLRSLLMCASRGFNQIWNLFDGICTDSIGWTGLPGGEGRLQAEDIKWTNDWVDDCVACLDQMDLTDAIFGNDIKCGVCFCASDKTF